MAYPYIVQADLENRLGAVAVARFLDHNGDGSSDAGPLARVIADASSKVAGYMRGIYDLDAVAANTPNEVKRLTLSVAIAMLSLDHPEVLRGDGFALMEMADRELRDLRSGKTRLDVMTTPEPGSQVGGNVFPGVPATTTQPTRTFFLGGTGDF